MKKAILITVIVAIVLLIPSLYGEWMRRQESALLQEERRLAAAEGLPIKVEDLLPKARIPPEENAALPLQEAHLMLASNDAAEKLGTSKEAFADVRSFLRFRRLAGRLVQDPDSGRKVSQVLAKPLALARDASKKSHYYLERDWEKGVSITFPEFSSYRLLVQGLLVSSWLKAQENRKDEALEELLAAARLSRLIREEPVVIALVTGSSYEDLTLGILQQLQRSDPSDRFWLDATNSVIAAFGPPFDVRRSLDFEVFATTKGLDAFMSPDAEVEMGLLEGRRRAFIRRDRRNQTEIAVLRAYRELFSKWPRDPNAYMDMITAAQRPAEQIDLALSDFSSALSQMSGGAQQSGIFGTAALASARSLSRRRLAKIYANALIAKLDQGDFPSTLPIQGEDITDPYSGSPFRYRSTMDGFLVYSVGENRQDDNGAMRLPNGEQGPPPDIVLRYP